MRQQLSVQKNRCLYLFGINFLFFFCIYFNLLYLTFILYLLIYCFILRYFDMEEFIIKEEFLGFIELSSTTGSAIKDEILN